MGGGAGTSKKKRTTLKEVIAKLNEAFGENVSPVDGARTVNAIVDSVSPQAIRPIAEMIYDLVNKKKHLDVEEISEYANNKE